MFLVNLGEMAGKVKKGPKSDYVSDQKLNFECYNFVKDKSEILLELVSPPDSE